MSTIVLIGTYEMGRQSFGLASTAAWLRESGHRVHLCDLSRDTLDPAAAAAADVVAWHLPMHTATRLLPPVVAEVRRRNPRARLWAFGLYAPLNAAWLRTLGIRTVFGPEAEAALVEAASRLACGDRIDADGDTPAADAPPDGTPGRPPLARLAFRVPDRTGLPPLERYARLRVGGDRRVVGYTEASRGCKHRCRHCPIVPVYDGRFRVVDVDVVLEDVARQVQAGARHITFGDPDFLNGPRHAMAVAERLHAEHPGVTYDVTIKVEHLLARPDLLPRLRETGCLFVTSAVESIDDAILARLEKGHTRQDVERVVGACCAAGLTLVPTFVAFTPWTTKERYAALLQACVDLDLVDAVAPVQLTIRLLVTEGSRLLELGDVRDLVGPFDREALAYPWRHPDPGMDSLQSELTALVGLRLVRGRREVFLEIWRRVSDRWPGLLPIEPFPPGRVMARADVPWLDEPWYC